MMLLLIPLFLFQASCADREDTLAVLDGAVYPDRTVYVDCIQGNDYRSGASWEESVKTLRWALRIATSLGGDGWTVLVADGTYRCNRNKNLDFEGKAIHMKSLGGAAWCTIDCVQDGRAFHFHSGEGSGSIVEGFTIINGMVEGEAPEGTGAGILCENNSSPTIRDCVFSDNWADNGGAIGCIDSSPTIGDCVFYDNSAGEGGAIGCTDSSPVIEGCTITRNWGWSGGGIYARGGNPKVVECTITDNPSVRGGGIRTRECSLEVTESTFTGNCADEGGAICCLWGDGHAIIMGCTFTGNYSGSYGGAIYCTGDLTVLNCLIEGNWTHGCGGGIHNDYGDLVVDNCILTGNSADYEGGGIAQWAFSMRITDSILTKNSADYGGGVNCWGADLDMANCLLTGNSAYRGGGIYLEGQSINAVIGCSTIAGNLAGGGIYCDAELLAVNNSVLWGNNGAQLHMEEIATGWKPGTTVMLNSCCYPNGPGDVTGEGTVISSNCIHLDPLFVDAGALDFRLQDLSPCIDAGDDSLVPAGLDTDLDGNQRIQGGAVDMGAYEKR